MRGDGGARDAQAARGPCFPDDIVSRWSRTDTALASAICDMWVSGVSTRKAGAVAAEMGVESTGCGRVPGLCASLDGEVAEMRSADLSAEPWPYLWLDAASDAHEGLARAVRETLPGAAWQRCVAHLERNARDRCRRRDVGEAAVAAPEAALSERDPSLARAGYRRACDLLAAEDPCGAEPPEEAAPSALACLDFPREHARWVRTNDARERTSREARRRTRVVRAFPSFDSLAGLVGAVCCDQNDAWLESRSLVGARSLRPDCERDPLSEEPGGVERVTGLADEAFDRRRRVA